MLRKIRVCALLVPALVGCAARSDNTLHTIDVIDHGLHTGLCIPADDLNRQAADLRNRFPEAEYYELGWGDAAFYQAEEKTTGLALGALFWPGDAVMHVVGFRGEPHEYFKGTDMRRVALSDKGYERLLRFVSDGFHRDGYGRLVATKRGIYGDSQFYRGTGHYHVLNTCNTWTTEALSMGGIRIESATMSSDIRWGLVGKSRPLRPDSGTTSRRPLK
jgi:uncharacterized protein (TIGR02117 family)